MASAVPVENAGTQTIQIELSQEQVLSIMFQFLHSNIAWIKNVAIVAILAMCQVKDVLNGNRPFFCSYVAIDGNDGL